ncbi:hypothetical protein Hanom_Chr05g00440401 [Helianthus anomalus]
MSLHCVLRDVLDIMFYTSCLLLCFTIFCNYLLRIVFYIFFVIVFYTLRFINHVLSYYMFPPVACRRKARRAKY